MANQHKVVYTVDKVEADICGVSYFSNEVITRYVFLTRKAANDFQEAKNFKTKKFKYMEPMRAVWGQG